MGLLYLFVGLHNLAKMLRLSNNMVIQKIKKIKNKTIEQMIVILHCKNKNNQVFQKKIK